MANVAVKTDPRYEAYYDPARPGAFSGRETFRRATGLSAQNAKSFLSEQDAYTLHRPVRRKFPRRQTIVAGPNVQWQADLADLSAFARSNGGNKYLLTCIDVFSKYAHVRPLRSKTGKELAEAFRDILHHAPPPPPVRYLQTDKGGEFLGKHFQDFLKHRNIIHFTTENDDTKATIVERFHRTFKGRMYRYFTANGTRRYTDVLQALVDNYNATYHRSIRTQPRLVGSHNVDRVQRALNEKHDVRALTRHPAPTLKAGDRVRIARSRQAFDKGFLPAWTRELFTVQKRLNRSHPYVYAILDDAGERVKGSFYEPELQKVTDKGVYAIEKIVRRRGRQVLVKWAGYSDNFNSWIPRHHVQRYKNGVGRQ